MRRACSLALLLASFTLLACSFSVVRAQSPAPAANAQEPAPESPEVKDGSAAALQVHVRELFQSGQYAQIDALAQQLRTQKTRFRGGAWQLNILYNAITLPGSVTSTDAEWQTLISRLQSWIAGSPNSPTPRIALGKAYTLFAWKARGNGTARTITPESAALFKQRIQSARTTLEEASALSVNCPEWYYHMQVVGKAQGWPRKQMDALVQTAIEHDPEYFYTALGQADYLLPKWYGKRGDTEAFAAQVADTIGGREGDAVYYLIASDVNCCRDTEAPGMDEARVQRGFTALEQLYGATNGERNAAAFLALRAGDTPVAQQLFARIGNDWEAGVWGSKARFDASRTGKPVGNVAPVGPETTATN